ncbi:phage/plasmid primase, P4 family, C-terminal domain-containing protein [Singulisphaera sp. GP187]|uniref:DNA primase family protein n=1 Tax=Singulisphaera sp. GP187 TaxID=1882752 RepID=UPI000929F3A9|nr:phage/plasmid primase, P4 family [Singulisphaera sp. GP187]SIO58415.1 phage/plasmid primase, P4 family, C-terminal domain-containing protein [Singulisphaera sp. GP187]
MVSRYVTENKLLAAENESIPDSGPGWNPADGIPGDGASDGVAIKSAATASVPLTGPPTPAKVDRETLDSILCVIVEPGDVIAIRIFGAEKKNGYLVRSEDYPKTYEGCYSARDNMAVDAASASGVSVYLISNPVHEHVLARAKNRLRKIGKGEGVSVKDIRCLRWAYFDFDAVKPDPNIPATDEERDAALALRDAFLLAHKDMAAHAIWGCSGNGGWVLVRLPDYPNDETHRAIVAETVDYAADNFGADRTTKNPARLSPLPGTVKHKGDPIPGRPHRNVTVDQTSLALFNRNDSFDLIGFHESVVKPARDAAQQATGKPASPTTSKRSTGSPKAGSTSVGGSGDRVEQRAIAYLAKVDPAIQGHHGSDDCFKAACVGPAFDFDEETTFRLLRDHYNERCEPRWSDDELRHKIEDAYAKEPRRGWLLGAKSSPPGEGEPVSPDAGEDFKHLDAPQAMARQIRHKKYCHWGVSTLRKHADEFYLWNRRSYRPMSTESIHDEVSEFVQAEIIKEFAQRKMAEGLKMAKKETIEEKDKAKERPLKRGFVADGVQALGATVRTHADSIPVWLDGEGDDWNASDVLSTNNALVYIPSYLNGEQCTRLPTPSFFTTHSLGYDWQPDAPKPERWLRFLAETWHDDQQSIDTLQEWFGLQLVPVTSYEKMLALIGPPRAGKGVIASMMREMVGTANCCGPTFSGLAETFGMQSLIGKLSAIIDDARLSGKSDQAIITERLLSISGQGCLDVRRMHRPQWTGVLTCRITLISNELPRLNDNANALANRFIVLKFTKSHLGSEDNSLKTTLLKELPGILLWSLEGLRRLNERGHFVQPESGRDIHEEMEDMSSPIGSFVKDCCVVDPDEEVEKGQLYTAWRAWCEQNGRKEAGELSTFARNLRTVVPSLKSTRPRDGGRRVYAFKGVGLLPPESLTVFSGDGQLSPSDEPSAEWFDQNSVPF